MFETLDKKRIVKNTFFLYFRMLFTMLVALYTSRIVLKVLGIEDYGLYQTIGGIVGILSFLNGALANASSRYLTFELGKNNSDRLNKVFSTILSFHVLLAILVIVIAETVGLYCFFNVLNIPENRLDITFWVYQFSIVTTVILITQVPYTAFIIAREKMKVYAYVSIIDVSFKLAIVYILMISAMDKLLFYSGLLCLVQFIIAMFYRFYCIKEFSETRYKFVFEKSLAKDISIFSGWSLLSNLSTILNNQGIIILLNIFFTPVVVSARAISIQVNMAVNQFVENFRMAVNPQIVKTYAQNKYDESQQLVLESAKISFFLVLLIGFPIILNVDYILGLWLVQVPHYTSEFVKLIIIQSLFQSVDTSLYYGLYAKGVIKQNSLLSPIIGILGFPICYILFKIGASPLALSWCYIVIFAFLAIVIKPFLLWKLVGYSYKRILKTFFRCGIVSVVAICIYLLQNYLLPFNRTITLLLFTVTVNTIIMVVSMYYWGLETPVREQLCAFIKVQISNCKK